jgi:hypothetical protein
MWAQATRVEFIVVSVALLVLLLCSNPPKSGNADVGDIGDLGPASPNEQVLSSPDLSVADSEDTPALDMIDENEPNEVSLDVPLPDDATIRQQVPRVAAVDARSCDGLDYKNVMYGQVTVRWVWNGTQFVPQKVCIVEEEDGGSSVWSFDQQEKAVLSELSGQPSSPH